ncbi:MAG: YtxH domain-containing protein [Holophaga sp.]|jgi:gas vesicle protein
MSQESNVALGPLLLTFVAGAALGAVVAALVTPRTGPELRGGLTAFGRRARRRAGEMAAEAHAALDGMMERTGHAAADLKRGITDSVQDLQGERP